MKPLLTLPTSLFTFIPSARSLCEGEANSCEGKAFPCLGSLHENKDFKESEEIDSSEDHQKTKKYIETCATELGFTNVNMDAFPTLQDSSEGQLLLCWTEGCWIAGGVLDSQSRTNWQFTCRSQS